MTDNVYYIIEYTNLVTSCPERLATVETMDDAKLYIYEHHKMIKKLYKKWYKNLKWTPKRDEVLVSVELDEEYDSFKDQTTLEQVIPNKKYVTRLWYKKLDISHYTLSGYEDYEIFEISKK